METEEHGFGFRVTEIKGPKHLQVSLLEYVGLPGLGNPSKLGALRAHLYTFGCVIVPLK